MRDYSVNLLVKRLFTFCQSPGAYAKFNKRENGFCCRVSDFLRMRAVLPPGGRPRIGAAGVKGVWLMEVDFTRLRQRMVDSQLRPVAVTRLPVLSAFLAMPRELFVPDNRRNAAYADGSVPVAAAKAGQPARYMMPAAALAQLIQLADIGSDDFILDIGAATGYGAALMAGLGSAVVALECDAELAAFAEDLFAAYKCENITVAKGDLPQGWTAQAPYDVIVLEGSVDFVPKPLFAQLREGGRLVAVEGRGNAAIAWLYEREEGIVSRRRGFNLALYPLPGFAEEAVFTF